MSLITCKNQQLLAYYYLNFRESHKITRLITMPLLIKTSYNTLLILEKINIIYYLIQ